MGVYAGRSMLFLLAPGPLKNFQAILYNLFKSRGTISGRGAFEKQTLA